MAIGNLKQFRKNVKEGKSVKFNNPTPVKKSSSGSSRQVSEAPNFANRQTQSFLPSNSNKIPTPNGSSSSADSGSPSFIDRVKGSPKNFVKGLGDAINLANKPVGGLERSPSGGFQTADGVQVAGGPVPPLIGIGGAAAAIKAVSTGNAISKSVNVGKLSVEAEKAISTAGMISTNTATTAKTANWFNKAAKASGVTTAAVGILMGAIGSYPFAGFIKEEALQTLGFGVKTALNNKDIAGAETAIALQKDVLNPDMWQQIKAGIPFVNVLQSLDSFYEAATIKVAIDERVIADFKTKIETGEDDSSFYQRIDDQRRAEEEEDRLADEEYYANVERQKKDAAAEGRIADLRYWDSVLARQEDSLRRKKQIELDYWAQYYKTIQQSRDDNAPSKLNFGII